LPNVTASANTSEETAVANTDSMKKTLQVIYFATSEKT